MIAINDLSDLGSVGTDEPRLRIASAVRPDCATWVLAIMLLAWPGLSAAQTCYEWRPAQAPLSSGAWLTSPEAVVGVYEAYCNSTSTTGDAACAASTTLCPNGLPSCHSFVGSAPFPNATFPQLAFALSYKTFTNVSQNIPGKPMNVRTNPQGCPACPISGTTASGVASGGARAVGTKMCGSDGCQYTVASSATTTLTSAGFQGIQTVKATGAACGQTVDSPAQEGNTDDECVSSGGDTACWNSTNCGEVNGDRVCVGTVPANGCIAYASGGVACVASAASPPAPDNGTPGVPATPTATIERPGQTTINYYNSTTVNGSSAPPTTSPPVDDPGGPVGDDGEDGGECDPEVETCGPGSASGGETCAAAPTCEGDPIMCAVLAQEWMARCSEMPSDEILEGSLGPGGEPADGADEGTAPDLIPTTEIDPDADLDDGGWISTRCPSDVVIDLGGDLPSVTVPISNWCEWMSIIGQLVMVAASLGAARIIMGGV